MGRKRSILKHACCLTSSKASRLERMSAQVVILGGGPAGLAAAIAAAQAGFSVLVAEPCFQPTLSASRADRLALPSSIGMDADAPADCGAIDKCCGEGLLPPALAALSALGLSPALLGAYGYPLAGIRFHTARRHAAATFAANTGLGDAPHNPAHLPHGPRAGAWRRTCCAGRPPAGCRRADRPASPHAAMGDRCRWCGICRAHRSRS